MPGDAALRLLRRIARGIPAHRIVLAGFSQGCAMALHTGLRFPQALAGIMALSGYLPLAERFPAERSGANAETNTFNAATGQELIGASDDDKMGLGLDYSNGPLKVGAVYHYLKDALDVANVTDDQQEWLVRNRA